MQKKKESTDGTPTLLLLGPDMEAPTKGLRGPAGVGEGGEPDRSSGAGEEEEAAGDRRGNSGGEKE